MKPKCLDLFCGAGGASMGLHRAGFDVTGVDIAPQPRYPFNFIQADAMTFPLDGYDFIWASPPCQKYSVTTKRCRHIEYPDLVSGTRARIVASGIPYVIENVVGAPLDYSITLCGTMFGQNSWRHRLFESSKYFLAPHCRHDLFPAPMNPYKSTSRKRNGITGTDATWRKELAIDWMTGAEASQCIPPAYSQFIGERILAFPPAPREAEKESA